MIAVHLNVVDEYGIERVTVNDNIADKLSSGGYYFNLSLNPGLNEIRITAINNKGMSTEKQFSVLVPTPAAGTIISIIEPPVMRGIKIVSKKELITVKGTAVDDAGVKEVLVNNRKAELGPGGSFLIEMSLNLGDNKLIVQAKNSLNSVKVDTFIISRTPEEMLSAGR